MPKMTTAETQICLISAAEIELDIRSSFRKIDRFKRMLTHVDANKLPQVKKNIRCNVFELLEHIDVALSAYELILDFIDEEQPVNWRVLA